jgi:hypothetical protein
MVIQRIYHFLLEAQTRKYYFVQFDTDKDWLTCNRTPHRENQNWSNYIE